MSAKCPRCGKESDNAKNPFRPFCSERCKLVDLGNWISGMYRISREIPVEDDEEIHTSWKDSDQE